MKLARLMLLPCILCAITMGLALLMAVTAGIGGTGLVEAYVNVGAFCTLIAFVIWLFVPPLRGPVYRPMSPHKAAVSLVRERWLLALLPLLVFPIFISGFTVAKISFPLFVGYHWDGFWTAADHLLFGVDPWRLTHQLFGVQASQFLTVTYTLFWGLALGIGLPIYAFSATPEQAIRAYTAMMATWLAAGVGGAMLFSSVGPIFADLVDPDLGQRFAPLRDSLATLLPADNGILGSQRYLRRAFAGTEAVRAGGISAMPSMHLGVCAILVILAWPGIWRIPAMLLWAAIWVGSVHFGYHYALDGIIGSAIAWLCWKATAPRPARAEIHLRIPALAVQ